MRIHDQGQRVISHAKFAFQCWKRMAISRRALHSRLSSRSDRSRALAVALTLWVRAATPFKRLPVPRLYLYVAGQRRALYLSSDTELFGLYEVFSANAYQIDFSSPVYRILDIGANIGAASLFFTERYPEAEIVALEPAPDTFRNFVRNVSGLSKIRPLHLALGADGTVLFDTSLPSTERHVADRGVAVQSRTLTALLDELDWTSVDLMKIDAEGAEYEVLADPAVVAIDVILAEVHLRLAPTGLSDPTALFPGREIRVLEEDLGATVIHAVRVQSPVAE